MFYIPGFRVFEEMPSVVAAHEKVVIYLCNTPAPLGWIEVVFSGLYS